MQPGHKLAHYEVVEPIGKGGMGEVYLARDTKLGRDVAIKVLPEEFSQDKERLERFEREARLLAQLNHSNIATLHGLDEHEGRRFLVMELVGGETLSERIATGPIPVDEAVELFIQIADGLSAAHEKGIIHRDLKPANIKVTPEGKAKILDFGLAKAYAAEAPSSHLSESPTITKETATGVILGTAAYMSPEQAKGKPLDRRTDVWAFGCCLFEALTGRRAFDGESVSEVLANVLKTEPDWAKVPDDTPAALTHLMKRCLAKEPRYRLRDIGDAWLMAHEASTDTVPESRSRQYSSRFVLVSVALAALVAGLAAWMLVEPSSSDVEPTRRFRMRLDTTPSEDEQVTLSADGTRLAYVAIVDGVRKLVVRDLNEVQDRVLPGTDDAYWPFFSPDGRWIAFSTLPETQSGRESRGSLKKISVADGTLVTLQEVAFSGQVVWAEDDSIIYQAGEGNEIYRIASDGGTPEKIFASDTTWYPEDLLPDGDAIFLVSLSAGVALLSLSTGELDVLTADRVEHVRFVPTGHLLFVREGTLMAAPFDRESKTLTAAPVPIVEGSSRYHWSVSRDGTLVYRIDPKSQLVWVDRAGDEEVLAAPAGYFHVVRISPDGSRAALDSLFAYGGPADVWIYEMTRGILTRLTLDPALHDVQPLWSPDGRRVVFLSMSRDGARNLSWKAADGSGEVERILAGETGRWPFSWSGGGDHLVFEENNLETGSDIGMLSMEDRVPQPVIRDPFDQTGPAVSPDGRWIAYESNESGRVEVFVQRFPELGDKRQISPGGGTAPLWAPDGMELFYRNDDEMMVVPMSYEPSFIPGRPRALFSGDYLNDPSRRHDLDPTGERFLMMKRDETAGAPNELHVVLNWFHELERLVPTKRGQN